MSVITLEGYRPSPRHDNLAWTSARIEGATGSGGPWTTVETFTLAPVDPNPAAPQLRAFTTENVVAQTWVRVVFVDADGDTEVTAPVPLASTAFASLGDVAARLGRELTGDEDATALALLEAATAILTEAAGKPDGWAPTPVPRILRYLAVEMVCRALGNAGSVAGTREQLGEYSYSETLRSGDTGGGLMLTKLEEALVRRTVWGNASGGVHVDSLIDDFYPEPVAP